MATAKDQRQETDQPAPAVDWIVLGANALGAGVVALAAFTAKSEGVLQQVASMSGAGAIF